jgi:hypothetical protein
VTLALQETGSSMSSSGEQLIMLLGGVVIEISSTGARGASNSDDSSEFIIKLDSRLTFSLL